MPESGLLEKIDSKQIDSVILAEDVIRKPEQLADIFHGLNSAKAGTKYGSEKILRLISERKPDLLYPHIDFFIGNLECENSFFRLGAIYVLANLAAVDSNNKINTIFEKYFEPISGPTLIAAANVIAGGARIALAKPALTEKIIRELLKVETAHYKTDECRNIAIGKTLESFGNFFNQVVSKRPVLEFVKRQLENPRKATQKKATLFCKKYREFF